jgi:hypothetical protein
MPGGWAAARRMTGLGATKRGTAARNQGATATP